MKKISPVGGPASGRLELPGTLISDYILRKPESPSELIVLLHGYKFTARWIFDALEAAMPASAAVLALNGPYPVPSRAERKFRESYAWYFYNPFTDEYLIDMSNAVRLIAGAVAELGFSALPARIIGFSQGGYLAPFAARQIPGARQVIGVAARFVDEEIDWVPAFRLDAVHGGKDEIVECGPAQESHRKLLARGACGEFRTDSDSGHELTPALVELVRERVGSSL